MTKRTYTVFYGLPEANLMVEVEASSPRAAATFAAKAKGLKVGVSMRVSAWNRDRGGGRVTQFRVYDGGIVERLEAPAR